MTAATDRYSLIVERRDVAQTCDDFEFLLRSEDARSLRVLLKSVLRGLKDEARDEEPVDLACEQTDEGPSLRVLGQDLDVRFTAEGGDFPTVDRMLEGVLVRLHETGLGPFDATLNPQLLARTVALQSAGRRSSAFTFRAGCSDKGGPGPVVVTPWDEDDDVTVAIMPIHPSDPALAEAPGP